MQLSIIKPDSLVSIDGVAYRVDLSFLPSGVRAVQVNGEYREVEHFDLTNSHVVPQEWIDSATLLWEQEDKRVKESKAEEESYNIVPMVLSSKHFYVSLLQGNIGDKFSGEAPSQADPYYKTIPSGVRYKSRVLWFSVNGLWLRTGECGNSYLLDSDYGPVTWHPAGGFSIEALEDGSQLYCLYPKDQEVYWERERLSLEQGEVLEIPSKDVPQILFTCSGSIEVNGKTPLLTSL